MLSPDNGGLHSPTARGSPKPSCGESSVLHVLSRYPGESDSITSPSLAASAYPNYLFHQVDTPKRPSQIKGAEIASPDEVFVGCCECGRLPPSHLSGPNTKLVAFLATESKEMVEWCLRALREAGLLSDAHLGVFLGWPVPCKKAFIDDLDAQERVKGKLVHATISAEKRGPTPGVPNQLRKKIPPPVDDSAEDMLTDPQKPLEYLLKAMDLPNNRGPFQEIVVRVTPVTTPSH